MVILVLVSIAVNLDSRLFTVPASHSVSLSATLSLVLCVVSNPSVTDHVPPSAIGPSAAAQAPVHVI